MHRLPYVDAALLNYLEALFPDKCPEPDASERDVWLTCGAVGVVRKLRSIHEEQREQQLGEF